MMKLQAISVFVLTVLYCSLSYGQDRGPWFNDPIISGVTPQHLQFNNEIRFFFKKEAFALNNEIKTALIKDINAIDTILGCVMQGFKVITLETDSFNFIKTDKKHLLKPVLMMFQPVSQTIIRERYFSTRTTETFLKRSHSNGDVTQYINVQDNDQVITYIGETLKKNEVWIITFLRKQSNAKVDKSFRTTFHVITDLLCERF